ncbi:MAG: chorismate mutase [Gemmatimonadales bacterium]
MTVRGLRGAITVPANDAAAIRAATRELLVALVDANGIVPDDVASVIFTVTPDLDADYPARAARDLGWHDVALLGATELAVPGGLPRCIRVLLHWNTTKSPHDLKHIYLGLAARLRPDR